MEMVYLDNSATTQVHPEVVEAMLPYLHEEYGNPSSKYYLLAENAKRAVSKAREQVAELVGCHPDEVVFTSGATESNNMVLKGVVDYYPNKLGGIVTTKVEHPSVIETCKYLETKGISVRYLSVDSYGRVSKQQVQNEIEQSPPLITSIMWGNNEIGSLNPIEEIASIFSEKNVFFHTDATQVIGKVPINLHKIPGLRFLSMSAHKLHGPKGIGACIIKKESDGIFTKITPLLHGGGQENNYRSGTLAVHNIVGFGKAAELALKNLENNRKQLLELEKYLTEILTKNLGDRIAFHNDNENKIPGILSVQFKGVNNELLLKKLSPYAALSTGSACSSTQPSHVLSAIGLSLDQIRQTIRISLSPSLTKQDLDFFKSIK